MLHIVTYVNIPYNRRVSDSKGYMADTGKLAVVWVAWHGGTGFL